MSDRFERLSLAPDSTDSASRQFSIEAPELTSRNLCIQGERMMEDTSKGAVLTQGFEPEELFKNGFTLKSIDLIQGGTFREVIGRTVIFLMSARQGPKGKRMFPGATVILPPFGASTLDENSVHEALTAGLEALRGASSDGKERAFLKQYVRVFHCATLEAADLAELVVRESDGRLVAVADGSKYRDGSVSLPALNRPGFRGGRLV